MNNLFTISKCWPEDTGTLYWTGTHVHYVCYALYMCSCFSTVTIYTSLVIFQTNIDEYESLLKPFHARGAVFSLFSLNLSICNLLRT